MTSNYNDDADSFFDPEPEPLKGGYDRGVTPPTKHRDSPVKSYDSPSPTHTSNNNSTHDKNMSHRSKDKHDDSYSRRHSGYSDRTYSKSNESYSDDDFESESEYDKRSHHRKGGGRHDSSSKPRRRTYSGTSSTYSASSTYGRSNTQYRPKNKGSPKKGKGRSQSQGSKMSPREPDVIAKRMLSARLHSINRLRNELGELQRDYDEVLKENKLLHTLQRKQERAIDKYEGQQNDLGDLLSRHNNEVEHLQKRADKYKQDNFDKERRLRVQNDELMKTQNALKRMKAIVRERNLLERDELSHKLQDTQEELDEKSKKCEDLERYVENLKKNHRVEIIELKHKNKDMEHKLGHLDHEHEKLKITLKEKEKELDIRNIYSHRIMRAPTKLSNVSTTPLPSSRKVKTANKAVQAIDLSENTSSVRDSLEFVEEEDETEETPQDKSRDNSFDKELEKERERQREEDRKRLEMDEAERRRREEDMKILMSLDSGIVKETDEEKRKREERERLEKPPERMKSSRHKRGSFLYKLEKKRQEREKKEKERKAQEEQERREREERDRREREEQERRDRERKEQEERDRANEAEREKLEEERRKKDILLAKMKEIDSGKNPTPPESAKSHKSYNFTDAIVNMHNGLPSHPGDETHSGKKRTKEKEEDVEFGSYAPSFGRRGQPKSKPKSDWLVFNPDDEDDLKKSPPAKDPNLMSDLFGSGEGSDKSDKKKPDLGDNIFTAATKAKPVSDKDAYPWEKDVNVSSQPRAGRRANNFFDDEEDEDKLLPRRPRDTNTLFTSSKPTVNAVDDFDDDIEEVIL